MSENISQDQLEDEDDGLGQPVPKRTERGEHCWGLIIEGLSLIYPSVTHSLGH